MSDPHLAGSENRPTKRVQIRIVDLLAWMLGTSLIMAGYQLFNEPAPNESALTQGVNITFRLIYSSVNGAMLAGAGFTLFYWLRAGDKLAPGQWLLLILTMTPCASFAWWAWFSHQDWANFSESGLYFAEFFSFGILLSSGLTFLLLAGHTYDSPRWTAFFVAYGLSDCLVAGLHLFVLASERYLGWYPFWYNLPYSTHGSLMLVLFLWGSVVVLLDVMSTHPRSGLHWTGALVLLVELLVGFAHFIVWMWVLPILTE